MAVTNKGAVRLMHRIDVSPSLADVLNAGGACTDIMHTKAS